MLKGNETSPLKVYAAYTHIHYIYYKISSLSIDKIVTTLTINPNNIKRPLYEEMYARIKNRYCEYEHMSIKTPLVREKELSTRVNIDTGDIRTHLGMVESFAMTLE